MHTKRKIEFRVSDLKIYPALYHPQQVPGWVAWVAVWKMETPEIMVSFLEITGDLNRGRPDLPGNTVIKGIGFPHEFYNMDGLDARIKILSSSDTGPYPHNKWELVSEEPFPALVNQPGMYSVKKIQDGTVIRTRWGFWTTDPTLPKTLLVSHSQDKCRSWGNFIPCYDPGKYLLWSGKLIQLKDGTIVLSAYGGQRDKIKPSVYDFVEGHKTSCFIITSADNGHTWSEPILVIPCQNNIGFDESALVELPNGDILMLARTNELQENVPLDAYNPNKAINFRRQVIIRKQGRKWVPGEVKKLDIPHGGHPELLMTREGILLYVSAEGYWATLDEGKTWTIIPELPPSAYYPGVVQLDDGRIFVCGHNGGDCPFPPPEDMMIWKMSFRLSG